MRHYTNPMDNLSQCRVALQDACQEIVDLKAKLAALVTFSEKLLGRERKEVYPDCDFCRDSGHDHECPGPIQNPRWAEIHDAIVAAKEPELAVRPSPADLVQSTQDGPHPAVGNPGGRHPELKASKVKEPKPPPVAVETQSQ